MIWHIRRNSWLNSKVISSPEKKAQTAQTLDNFLLFTITHTFYLPLLWSGLLFLVIVVLKCWDQNFRSLLRSSASLLLSHFIQLPYIRLTPKWQSGLHHLSFLGYWESIYSAETKLQSHVWQLWSCLELWSICLPHVPAGQLQFVSSKLEHLQFIASY